VLAPPVFGIFFGKNSNYMVACSKETSSNAKGNGDFGEGVAFSHLNIQSACKYSIIE